MTLIFVLLFSVLATTDATDDCSSRWSVAGIHLGMRVQDLTANLAVSEAEALARANGELVEFDRDATGFHSRVSVGVCIDDNGVVSLLTLQFSGSRTDLERDRNRLRERWSSGHELPLGVADVFSDVGGFGHFQSVAFDDCGANALIQWMEDRAGIKGLWVGIRPGFPEFVTPADDKYLISQEVLTEVGWQYARCKP